MPAPLVTRDCLARDYVYDRGAGDAIEIQGLAHDVDLFWPDHEAAGPDGWLRRIESMRLRFAFRYDTSEGHDHNLALLERFRDQSERCVAGCRLDQQGAAIVSLETGEAVAIKLDAADLDRPA